MTGKEAKRTARPDPEVKPLVQRRTFSKAEKLRILEEADACSEPGEIGALVRREGIYTSYLSRWRRARERGELRGSQARQRGPQAAAEPEQAAELTELRQENARLQTRLQQAETIIEVQKNSHSCLGRRARPRSAPRTHDSGCRDIGRNGRDSGGVSRAGRTAEQCVPGARGAATLPTAAPTPSTFSHPRRLPRYLFQTGGSQLHNENCCSLDAIAQPRIPGESSLTMGPFSQGLHPLTTLRIGWLWSLRSLCAVEMRG